MARRKAPLHVNQFVGGLNTETGPLTNVLETSKDELNMDLNRDGSRSKRVGFDYEANHVKVNTTVGYQANKLLASTSFKWDNAGGDPDKSLLVVQVASNLSIFDLDSTPVSGDKIFSQTFSSGLYQKKFSYSTLGGLLIVATGRKNVKVYEYDGSTITSSSKSLFIRDLFGVEAFAGSKVLTEIKNVEDRPTSLEDTHTYNLRNQTFDRPRRRNNSETLQDPIWSLFADTNNIRYPSNSDSVIPYLYPDPNDTNNRTVNRFFSENLVDDRLGTTPAPKGHFIIDAMERGIDRLAEVTKLQNRHAPLKYPVKSLPADTTSGGPSVVTDYAGRFWYGGFSSVITGSDAQSPTMESYILFSQVVQDDSNFAYCYQKASPTSEIDAAIVDSDGGFISLDKAYNINNMIEVSGNLFVFAENGIWRVSSQDARFRATEYEVDKITSTGCVGGDSVVVVDDTIFFWGDSAIFTISRNEFGIWVVQDLTRDSIRTHYIEIDIERKKICSAHFDTYDRTIRWVYNTQDNPATSNSELRYHVDRGAFTVMNVPIVSQGLPRIVSVTETNPYTAADQVFDVTAGGVVVTAQGANVTVTLPFRTTEVRDSLYVVVSQLTPTIKYSLGSYSSNEFYDWPSQNNTNYEAYIVTQNLTFGDPKSRKSFLYLSTFFRRTENGFDSNLDPVNPSSCLMSCRFGWADNALSNKWSTPRQVYRYPKTYTPANDADPFETGFELISTQNKIRGSGQAVSLRYEAEAGKQMHLHGWSFNIDSKDDD